MFKHLRLYAPDPYDYILSKQSGIPRKIETMPPTSSKHRNSIPKPSVRGMRKNYGRILANEDRHDTTLILWIEIFERAQ